MTRAEINKTRQIIPDGEIIAAIHEIGVEGITGRKLGNKLGVNNTTANGYIVKFTDREVKTNKTRVNNKKVGEVCSHCEIWFEHPHGEPVCCPVCKADRRSHLPVSHHRILSE